MDALLDIRTGWAFLIFGVWNAAFTFNAYRPVSGFGTGVVAFFAGWLTCELALHHLIWQVGLSLAFIYGGALDAPLGMTGLGFSVASWAGLVRLHRRGNTACDVARKALEESFADGLEELSSKGPVGLRHIARPFSMAHPRVKRIRDVVFTEVDGTKLHLDVFHREDRPEGAPVLVFVHGGAWILGYKEYQAMPMLYRMASQGWVCITVDYRLSPKATFPAHLVDVKSAIVWAKEHAGEYGGDPSFVALSGNSAGGHLASLAALTWDDASYQPGFEDADTRVDACVSFYGVYDLTGSIVRWPGRGVLPFLEFLVMKQKFADDPGPFERASPILQVRPDAPPFLIVHGEKDSLVPVGEGRAFAAELRKVATAPVVYVEIPDGQHAFEIFRSVRGHHTLRAVEYFLKTIHRRAKAEDPEAVAAREPNTLGLPARTT